MKLLVSLGTWAAKMMQGRNYLHLIAYLNRHPFSDTLSRLAFNGLDASVKEIGLALRSLRRSRVGYPVKRGDEAGRVSVGKQ